MTIIKLCNRLYWLIGGLAVVLGSKYRGGFSLLVPLWNDGIQLSTWRRANALAHDDGMFTLWTTPDGNVCMYVCMYVDRDVRHGQVTQDHDDEVCIEYVCMYVCMC